MPEILFRWNYYTKQWEVYSLSLQSWQPSFTLTDQMTEQDVRAYFLAFGAEAKKRTPVTYEQGRLEVERMLGHLGKIADHNEREFNV